MAQAPTGATPQLFGHPRGLTYLFTTEMWERFSYYGMRALLVIYLTNYLLLQGTAETVLFYPEIKTFFENLAGKELGVQPLSSWIYGSYTGLVYFTPLIGGYLADRFFGRRVTVIVGALLMALGHFLMAFENLLFIALLFLILGNGAFKPNISTQVSRLYAPGDHRIDRAYSIFYLGINLGAALGSVICGTLGETVSWHYGFGAAGVGMLIGTIVYIFALRELPKDDIVELRKNRSATEKVALSKGDWSTVIILCLLFIPSTLFWATYEQSGNTIALWAQSYTDRILHIGSFSFTIPVTWFQWLNPVLIILLTPFVVSFWRWQDGRGKEPAVVIKMVTGCILVCLAYLVMAYAAHLAGPDGQASWLWLLLYFVLLTTGELYISPIGLALYAKAAPKSIVSLMVGVWLATSFPGNFLGGYLGSFWSSMDKVDFFLMIAQYIAGAAVVIFFFNAPMKRILNRQEQTG